MTCLLHKSTKPIVIDPIENELHKLPKNSNYPKKRKIQQFKGNKEVNPKHENNI